MAQVSYVTDNKEEMGRTTKSEQVYDPKTGTWTKATATTSGTTSSKSTSTKSTSSSKKTTSSSSSSGSSSSSKSKASAEKEYIDVEFNTLTGEMTVTPTDKTIRINVNDTIQVYGIGKYLSGQYYVSQVRRTLNKDSGYTQVFTLIKNGFGDSLKKSNKSSDSTSRKEEVTPSTSKLKVGDRVKIVGAKAVYSNAHDGVKVPAWVKKKTHTVDAISKDGTRVRLKEIWSWTYVKFIQKV